MERLARRIAEARAAWPSLSLDAAGFARYVAERTSEEGVEDARLADLYLAYGCALRDPRALELFHQTHWAPLRGAVARVMPPDLVDDVARQALEKLLYGSGDAVPAIAKFAGRGELSGWVQIVATRHAYDVLRRKERRETEWDALVDRVTASGDPELEAIKRRYRAEFKAAFQKAFETLGARERNVLRYELLDGLTIDEIARLQGVHRATVARWRASLREQLFRETRRIFAEDHGIPAGELSTIVRLIQSQLDASLPRLLGEP